MGDSSAGNPWSPSRHAPGAVFDYYVPGGLTDPTLRPSGPRPRTPPPPVLPQDPRYSSLLEHLDFHAMRTAQLVQTYMKRTFTNATRRVHTYYEALQWGANPDDREIHLAVKSLRKYIQVERRALLPPGNRFAARAWSEVSDLLSEIDDHPHLQ